jgi:hypothetical protein
MKKYTKPKDQELVSRRKSLKKSTASRLGIPIDSLKWLDGRLCMASNNSPIDGVPAVAKPVKPVKPKEEESWEVPRAGIYRRWSY